MIGVNTVARTHDFGVAAELIAGAVYDVMPHRGRPVTVLAEHRADVAPSGIRAVSEEA